MHWHSLIIFSSRDNILYIEELLHSAGSISVSIEKFNNIDIFEEHIGHMPIWDSIKITGIFENIPDLAIFNELHHSGFISKIQLTSFEDKDWVEHFKLNLKPILLLNKLKIVPLSYTKESKKDEIILKIDPGMAFGSGYHETTQLCLESLLSQDLSNMSLLDYGCGSGILSIAAALLGAKYICGIDNDPLAVNESKKNAEKNNLDKKIFFGKKIENANKTFDIVVANIFKNTLINLLNEFSCILKPRGKLLLSGILICKIDEIKASFENSFDIIRVSKKKEWGLIELEKK